jgi:hypothetical protein
VVAVGEFDGGVVAERRRAVAHVDHHVDDGAVQAAHELAHRRVPLEVQAAHDALLRPGLDRLAEVGGDAVRVEIRLDPRLQQESPLVDEVLGGDHLQSRQILPRAPHNPLSPLLPGNAVIPEARVPRQHGEKRG